MRNKKEEGMSKDGRDRGSTLGRRGTRKGDDLAGASIFFGPDGRLSDSDSKLCGAFSSPELIGVNCNSIKRERERSKGRTCIFMECKFSRFDWWFSMSRFI